MKTAPAAIRWTVYLAIAVVFAIACAFLSNWQFERSEERNAELALIAKNYDAPPVSLDVAVPEDDVLEHDAEWQPVLLEGEYLADETVLARNRPRGGTSAYEVLVPFQTESGRILIVNRGWIPPTEDSQPSAIPAPPSGTVSVLVRLRPGESLPRSGRSAPEGQVPMIHLPTIAESTGPNTVTSAFGLMVSEDPAPSEAAPNALPEPTEDPGPHLSYAIQWILFAIMGFIFIVYVIRTEVRNRREDAPPQPKRRRDRDAAEEDALLGE